MSSKHGNPSLDALAVRLDALERLRIEQRDHERERESLRAEALTLQAKEYERRLADLNHAQREADRRNATYISREIYESEIGGLRKLVYIGVGIILAVQAFLWLIPEFAGP